MDGDAHWRVINWKMVGKEIFSGQFSWIEKEKKRLETTSYFTEDKF